MVLTNKEQENFRKELRYIIKEEKGWTIKKVAQACGIDRYTLGRYLNGKTEMRAINLLNVLAWLNLTVTTSGPFEKVSPGMIKRYRRRRQIERYHNMAAYNPDVLLKDDDWWKSLKKTGRNLDQPGLRNKAIYKDRSGHEWVINNKRWLRHPEDTLYQPLEEERRRKVYGKNNK
jgi:transcriptional regulator with XRE-family HTH domain